MEVKATLVTEAGESVEVSLSQEEQDQLARIFELGVNVLPNTPQVVIAVIKTPGYREGGEQYG